jgi:hypothetical protein
LTIRDTYISYLRSIFFSIHSEAVLPVVTFCDVATCVELKVLVLISGVVAGDVTPVVVKRVILVEGCIVEDVVVDVFIVVVATVIFVTGSFDVGFVVVFIDDIDCFVVVVAGEVALVDVSCVVLTVVLTVDVVTV